MNGKTDRTATLMSRGAKKKNRMGELAQGHGSELAD